MKTFSLLIHFFEKYYILLMIFMAILITWLNYYGHIMLCIYPYYQDFKKIILSGFDPNAGVIGTPTFPMWGYGWLLILTENKLVLIAIQFLLALFSIWYAFRMIKEYNLLTKKENLILKFLLFISVPWYAFHSIRWPYSISISLVTLSIIIFLVELFLKKESAIRIWKIVLSGILFGIALNFRSDYYLLPILFGITYFTLKKINLFHLKNIILWLVSIYILLIPWGIYTYKATSHYFLTSTNAGHVFFIGLGDLPDNKWGVELHDRDPLMHQLILEKFGEPNSTLLYETDRFLKKEFIIKIKEDPIEYLKKVIYSFKKFLSSGVYPGEFYKTEMLKLQNADSTWIEPADTWIYEDAYYEYMKNRINYNSLFEKLVAEFSLKVLIEHFSLYFGKIVVLLSILISPISLIQAFRRKNYFILFILVIIAFQAFINMITYNYRCYTSNIYFFLLINLVFGTSVFLSSLKKMSF